MKRVTVVLSAILVALMLVPAVSFAMEAYYPGNFVQLDNGTPIWVSKFGNGEKAIVYIPGLGSESPTLEFKPIAEALIQSDPSYSVYVIELPGYGLTPENKIPRTIGNITAEIHGVVEKLQIAPFTSVAHSIGGLYMLYYANEYPEDLNAFIGIDQSVSHQYEKIDSALIEGMIQGIHEAADAPFDETVDETLGQSYVEMSNYPYSDAEQKLLNQLGRKASNQTICNEVDLVNDNLAAAENLKFPETLRALMLIGEQSETDETYGIPDWIQMHEDLITSDLQKAVVIINGPHIIHMTNRDEVVQEMIDFLSE